MKNLSQYIKEELDDNMYWKIDTFFINKENDLNLFNNMVDTCRNTINYNVNTIEDFINKNNSFNYFFKEFIDFVDNTIHYDDCISKNYYTTLYRIIKQIIGNKQEGLKYTNMA